MTRAGALRPGSRDALALLAALTVAAVAAALLGAAVLERRSRRAVRSACPEVH